MNFSCFFCCDNTDIDGFIEPVRKSVFFHVAKSQLGRGDKSADAFQIGYCAAAGDAGDLDSYIFLRIQKLFQTIPAAMVPATAAVQAETSVEEEPEEDWSSADDFMSGF